MLAEHVEDEDHNTTRFVDAFARARSTPGRATASIVTTFVFQVRNLPAALYKAMGGFATNGVNMTKLESYMIEGNFFATMFYADVEGHPDDPPLARRAGGARILLAGAANPRRVSGAHVSARLQGRKD